MLQVLGLLGELEVFGNLPHSWPMKPSSYSAGYSREMDSRRQKGLIHPCRWLHAVEDA